MKYSMNLYVRQTIHFCVAFVAGLFAYWIEPWAVLVFYICAVLYKEIWHDPQGLGFDNIAKVPRGVFYYQWGEDKTIDFLEKSQIDFAVHTIGCCLGVLLALIISEV